MRSDGDLSLPSHTQDRYGVPSMFGNMRLKLKKGGKGTAVLTLDPFCV